MRRAVKLNGVYEADGTFTGFRFVPPAPTTATTHAEHREGLCCVLGCDPRSGPQALLAHVRAAHDAARVAYGALAAVDRQPDQMWLRARALAEPSGPDFPWCPTTRTGARAAIIFACTGSEDDVPPADFVALVRQAHDVVQTVGACTGRRPTERDYWAEVEKLCAWPSVYDMGQPPREPCRCPRPRFAS